MPFFRKTSQRRSRIARPSAAEQLVQITRVAGAEIFGCILLGLLFFVACVAIISFDYFQKGMYSAVAAVSTLVLLLCIAAAIYIYQYQARIIKNRVRLLSLILLLLASLAAAKIGILLTGQPWWGTASAVATAVILSLSYDRRFALGMGILVCTLIHFAAGSRDAALLFAMVAGSVTCALSLREIRTRMKLLGVSALAGAAVFATGAALNMLAGDIRLNQVFYNTLATFVVGILIQGLLPVIERTFRIATAMTLLDYSDANQPLLKRLAMEAPGTYSHSLLIGTIAEAAAESIGRNGLLCRVGAYYHDIGKINKPGYFVENQPVSFSKHKELSPAMSQLVIVGHVKDGMELASEYGLPMVLRQFIETHHGKTLVEYFYNEARKRYEEKHSPEAPEPSESDFRYPGPKPRSKEAAIVMLADAVEGATRSLAEPTPTRIEAVVHNIAMKRLLDGQFDECDLSLRELSQIEASISRTLAAHYHSRIAYPTPPDIPEEYVNA